MGTSSEGRPFSSIPTNHSTNAQTPNIAHKVIILSKAKNRIYSWHRPSLEPTYKYVISTEGGALCRRSGEIPVFRFSPAPNLNTSHPKRVPHISILRWVHRPKDDRFPPNPQNSYPLKTHIAYKVITLSKTKPPASTLAIVRP
jgi:hypothetical protein